MKYGINTFDDNHRRKNKTLDKRMPGMQSGTGKNG